MALEARHTRRAIGTGPEQGGVAIHSAGRRTQLGRSRRRRPQPALCALPLDELRVRQREHRRGLWHREAPQARIGRRGVEEGQALVAARVPVGAGLCVVHAGAAGLARHAFTGRFHRGHRTAQAHEQQLGRIRLGVIFHPTRGVDWQRLATPAVQLFQRIVLSQREHQRGLGQRHRQHLEAHFADQTQRAHGPGHHAAHVVARHVFHDLPAEGQQLTTAVDEARAQHVVAHRARRGPRRAGQARGHHAAHGAARAEARRLERKTLALAGQQRLHLGQWRAGAHCDHKFGGLVADNARPVGGGELGARGGHAEKGLGAPADDEQRLSVGAGLQDLVDQVAGVFGGAGLHPDDGSRRGFASL